MSPARSPTPPPTGEPLPTGKLPAELLRALLAEGGALPAEVLLGPAVGEDACAVALGDGVLVVGADPITLTGSGVGAHAVVINANDVAVTGVRPRWFLATALLPSGTAASEVRDLFRSTRAALERLGAVLVGGHTEITEAVRQPLISGVMLGFAPDGRFVRSGGAGPGDAIVQVGAVPVEGAAVLAREWTGTFAGLDPQLRTRAERALEDPGVCVVEPALAAAELGATALHDPTEGGLAAGLLELAEASGLALEIDPDRVLWFEPGVALCRALGADPWATLGSGTLLAAFPGDRADACTAELERRGFEARRIGRAEVGAGVHLTDGRALLLPERDEVARLLEGRADED